MNMDQNMIDGVTKISDNNFKVRIDCLVEEKSTQEEENFELKFSNPRYLSETFDEKAVGCSASEMEFLKLSIQEHGLLTPLIGRIKANKVSLINGHRRFHAIQSLIKNNELCFDPCTKENVPARILYQQVDVKVFENANEMDCYVLAFAEDKNKVKFGAGVEYKFVQYCVQNEIKDEKILQMTGNNQKWLDGVKSLLKRLEDDYEILDALFSNRMNLSAAKKIAELDDPQERMSVFKEAKVVASEETVQKKQKQQKSIISTKKKIESALADKVTASFAGDSHAEQEADDLIESYRKQEEVQQEALNGLETKITGRNVVAVRPAIKSRKKIEKIEQDKSEVLPIPSQESILTLLISNWIQPLDEMLDEKDMESNKIYIEFAKEILESVMDNSTSCSEFMSRWLAKLDEHGLVG